MSVVAVRKLKNSIEIASDSIRVFGYTQEKDVKSKLLQLRDGVVVGAVGVSRDVALLSVFSEEHFMKKDAEVSDIMRYMVEFCRWSKLMDPEFKLDSNFILVVGGKVFFVESTLFIREIKDFFAIGAGMDFALAALHLGRSVSEAVNVACDLSIYCEKPVNLIKKVIKK